MVLDGPCTFILGPDETVEESPAGLAHHFLEETRSYWQDWVRTLAIPFDWQEEVIRAAITLKLCTFEDTGAVMAALTTSIPESPHSGRTWDYRYCWLRDAYFVIQALNRLGATRTMEGYLHYIDQIVARSGVESLQPLYRISGDAMLRNAGSTRWRVPGDGPGPRGQPGGTADSARCVRLGDPGGEPAFLRPATDPAGQPGVLRAAGSPRRARCGDL